ncbi:MAG: helix-turn-helix domain-containing protein [Oryzihumus sp.]
MASDFARVLGARLRSVRTQQGLSLQAVQDRSEGRFKAVVVGSWERGDRAVTVERLAELARFYGVTVAALLPDGGGAPGAVPDTAYGLDLRALARLQGEPTQALERYAATLRSQRGEDSPELPLTEEDLRALASIHQVDTAGMLQMLRGWGVLVDTPASRVNGLGG